MFFHCHINFGGCLSIFTYIYICIYICMIQRRFRRFTRFSLAACRIARAILWSKFCNEQFLSFLFGEQCSLKSVDVLAIENSNTRLVAILFVSHESSVFLTIVLYSIYDTSHLPPLTLDYIQFVIKKKLKRNTATGLDGWRPHDFKLVPDCLLQALLDPLM